MRFVVLSVLTISLVCSSRAACSSSVRPGPREHALDDLRSAALAYYGKGQLPEAASCYRSAVESARALGLLNMDSTSDLRNLGALLEEQGSYGEASQYYSDALALLNKLGQNNSVTAGEVYEQLADLQSLEGKLPDAEARYKEAITRLDHASGPESIHTAEAKRDLGRLYLELGKMREASRLAANARRIAEKAVPGGDPRLIDFLDLEAAVLCDTGKYSAAERKWQSAVEIAEQAYGRGSRKSFGLLLHLGQMYWLLGDFESAEEMLDRSRAAESEVVGSDPIDRALIMSLLADTYAHRQKHAEAESLATQAGEDAEKTCNATPLLCGTLHSVLGDYYMLTRQWAQAERQYTSALTLRQAVLGERHRLTAESLKSLSKAFRKLKRKKEARNLEAKATRIMASLRDPYLDGANTVDVRALRSR